MTTKTEETKLPPGFILGMGKDVDMKAEQRYSRGMWRFWLPEAGETQIVFLSHGDGRTINDSPAIWEHQVALFKKGKKDWKNWFSCSQATIGDCPLCRYANEYDMFWRAKVQLFTVLNLKEWEDKKGKKHAFTKTLLAAKQDAAAVIMRKLATQLDNGKTLRGAQFKVFRAPGSKSNVGSDFEYVRHVDLDKLSAGDPTVGDLFDIATVVPDRERLNEVVKILRGVGGEAADSGEHGDSMDDTVNSLPSHPVEFSDADTLAAAIE